MLTGTIINSLTILAGSAVGLVLRAVTRRSSKEVSADGLGGRLQTIIMQGMALCVLYIGVSGCLKGQNTLTAILSIALGAIIGELLDLDRRMRSLGDWVQTRTARLIHTEDGAPSISDGFVTASLLFCVGAMAIVGALVLVPLRFQIQPQRLMHHRVVIRDQNKRIHRHNITPRITFLSLL